MKKISTQIYEHLILPVINNVAPVNQVSWGVAFGLIVGLTPTMGVQMYILALIWTICRFLFRFQFYLPVGIGLVWITNPVTVAPIYFLYLKTGNLFFKYMEISTISLNWLTFQEKFVELLKYDTWDMITRGTLFLFQELGIPMFVGSLFYAIPSAIIFYFVTRIFLTRYRKRKALQENLTYEEWRLKNETMN